LQIPSPKMCWTTSSPLTAVQRKIMERAFGCKVLDQYGCCEVFWLAQECPHQLGLHVNYDFRDITIIDEKNRSINATGEQGKIAITDFHNQVFPIIKYLNGDEGSYKNEMCSCGLPFPLLRPVKGRVTD